MEITGILRHENSWLERLRESSDDLPVQFAEGFVFLVSRPATGVLPLERKRRSLEHLADCIHRLGAGRIVVKRHPKEAEEDCFDQVLGRENYGKTWIYSRNHPLDLGARCAFAVSFYSGIVVDMAWLGVPSIEYLDLRGIPDYDNADSLRDAAGNPVLGYCFNHLAVGVQDKAGLEKAMERIQARREEVASELQSACRRIFPVVDGARDAIARQIAREALSGGGGLA